MALTVASKDERDDVDEEDESFGLNKMQERDQQGESISLNASFEVAKCNNVHR